LINLKFSVDNYAKLLTIKDQSVIENNISAMRKAGQVISYLVSIWKRVGDVNRKNQKESGT
jgi:hypothetical protein